MRGTLDSIATPDGLVKKQNVNDFGFHGPYVLLVEDDRDLRQALTYFLEDAGLHTVGACNGEAAIELLRTAAHSPAVIVSDINMPIMDGVAFRSWTLSDPATSRVPFVFMSGARTGQAIALAMDADCLEKPISGVDLATELARRYFTP